MYDGQPYIVRFGAEVIGDLLKTENSEPTQSSPPVRLGGSALEIGPGAIHPGQRLTYSLLVDGKESIEQISPLLDIKPRKSTEPNLLAEFPDLVIYRQHDGTVRTTKRRLDKDLAWHRHPALPAAVPAVAAVIGSILTLILGRAGALPSSLNPAPPPVTTTTTVTHTPTPPAPIPTTR
jgi:hypothetical protein